MTSESETPQAGAATPAAPAPGHPEHDQATIEELTDHLQRVSAEYANYRKRTERDRHTTSETTTATLLSKLLPVLDDLDRAREHDQYTGALRSIGDKLETITTELGLTTYGQPGEPFDPNIHEAMTYHTGAGHETPQIHEVYTPGGHTQQPHATPRRSHTSAPPGAVTVQE